MNSLTETVNLREAARDIFETALRSVDAGAAVRRMVQLRDSRLTVADASIDFTAQRSGAYVIALGKAAPAMAAALADVLGHRITAGVISGPAPQRDQSGRANSPTAKRWQFFPGGHPLPNQQSLNAAQAAFDLLKCAELERAPVLFLISGGGSAMIEWPIDEQITLADLSKANRLLVSCGASIAEINVVRRAISAVKGGRLAARAPHAPQITLIISDTNTGDEANVASGPTLATPADAHDAQAVVASYVALSNLPTSILKAINNAEPSAPPRFAESPARSHHVLLDNSHALEAAAAAARSYGFLTEIAFEIVEPGIEAGCTLLLDRLNTLRARTAGTQQTVCLISGGEFRCPVRGNGVGGRNAETVLRWAIELDQQNRQIERASRVVVLSAGTDGIDGNSPAAGAIADDTTLQRANALDLDARSRLRASDAFSFFDKLGEALVTGPTGTNVRDLRILLAH